MYLLTNATEQNKMTNLIAYKSTKLESEPELSPSVSRRHLRQMVRACLLRDRTFEETMRQVRRVYANARGLERVALHFYNTEVAA